MNYTIHYIFILLLSYHWSISSYLLPFILFITRPLEFTLCCLFIHLILILCLFWIVCFSFSHVNMSSEPSYPSSSSFAAPSTTISNTAGRAPHYTPSIVHLPSSFLQMAALFLQYKININKPDHPLNLANKILLHPALHSACIKGDLPIVQYLYIFRVTLVL
eukprot:TRINITY_DN1800_c0_g2_i1.p1 TRINITY_DN1800_c0_g2~~TRINITY_DN1800_c0_g2_i1.p1  ORF type:complete len:162 (-),score=17.47 TRINITY_DN1800_c0_g2_i1:131-616(-)